MHFREEKVRQLRAHHEHVDVERDKRPERHGHDTQFFFAWQILQLYVAAYQPPTVWRDVWRYLVGVISVQIIKDVEAFVAKHEFAHEDVMRFLVRS